MNERYIAVSRLCEWLKNLKSGFTKDELVFRDELIEHLQGNNGIANVLPVADVVEVVRCKDCQFRGNDLCAMTYYSEYAGCYVDETEDCDFCSYGERGNNG